jgi:uncharacterized protein YfaP (DUF2135 family)
MRPFIRNIIGLICLIFTNCDRSLGSPGLEANLFVDDAQFVAARMPSSPADGPTIVSITPPRTEVQAGGRTDRISGLLDASATAVLLGLEGDEGYWIVNTGAATLAEPDLPTFDAEISFARHLSGPVHMLLRAVDNAGRIGPEQRLDFEADEIKAQGELVITLRWDTSADLDLHVVDPLGEEVWAGNINSFKRPPIGSASTDRNAWMNGGVLDIDSNAGCVQDSRHEENVVWSHPPPKGRYEVRIASASMCEAEVAHWTVEVSLLGSRLARVDGTALDADTRHGAMRGTGVRATSFTVP